MGVIYTQSYKTPSTTNTSRSTTPYINRFSSSPLLHLRDLDDEDDDLFAPINLTSRFIEARASSSPHIIQESFIFDEVKLEDDIIKGTVEDVIQFLQVLNHNPNPVCTFDSLYRLICGYSNTIYLYWLMNAGLTINSIDEHLIDNIPHYMCIASRSRNARYFEILRYYHSRLDLMCENSPISQHPLFTTFIFNHGLDNEPARWLLHYNIKPNHRLLSVCENPNAKLLLEQLLQLGYYSSF